MMYDPHLSNYLKDLTILGYDISDYVHLTHSYILLDLLIRFAKSDPNYSLANTKYSDYLYNSRYLDTLEKYNLSPLPTGDEHVKSCIENLCNIIENFIKRQGNQYYFQVFTPGIVSNWNGLLKFYSSEIHMLLFLRFTIDFVSVSDYLSSEKPLDEKSILSRIYINKAEYYKPLGIDRETFIHCCDYIFNYRLRHRNIVQPSARTAIRNGIRIYNQFKLPRSALLEDYRNILNHRVSLDGSLNPWLYFQQKIKQLPVESGLSDLEVAFNEAAYVLHKKDISPTDIICTAFYPPERDDSAFENSFLYDEFRKNINDARNILIVNPSPQNIIYWIRKCTKYELERTVFAVSDNTVADLYHHQFGIHFIAIDDIPNETRKYDALLIIARDTAPEKLYPALSLCERQAEIIAFLPQSEISSTSNLNEHIKKNLFSIDKIIALPTSISNSTPRKKMVLYASESTSKNTFQLLFAHCHDISPQYITFEKRCYLIPRSVLFGNITLTQIRDNYLRQHSSKIVNHPKEPQIYYFSEEIKLYFTLHSNRKNRYAAKACYRAILRPNEKGRKRGNRLTEIIEKGLRAESENEVVQNLKHVVFDDRIAPFIVRDILDYYSSSLLDLSLKTIWFCCRNTLVSNSAYNENIALEMFCGANQPLSCLHPKTAVTSDYEACMHELLPEEARKGLKYWRQLDLIFRIAKTEGFVSANPISTILERESHRASTEEKEIRNALTKKIFSNREEFRMLEYLFTTNPDLCILDSQWLGCAICFYTGMHIGEVCGLTWGDFVQINTWNAYQFIISGYITQQDVFHAYESPSEWIKCRKVPVHPRLAEILLARKEHVIECNQTAESQVVRLPIVQSSEIGKISKCPRAKIKDKSQLLISKAGILPQIVSIPDPEGSRISDLHRYNGDIMYTNYKHKVTELCGFTLGERSYVLGIQAPNTFSLHYCDYGHDLIQYGMVQKLNRWSVSTKSIPPFYSASSFQTESNDTAKSAPGLVASVDIYMETLNNSDNGQIDISIESEFGVTGSITVFEEECL